MKRYAVALTLVYIALLLALIPNRHADSTGSLTIPNTIAAQSGPTLSASLLDQNWTTTATYINVREVTSGTLAARPAAGTSGRWYTATDQNGGITYWDNGSSWVQAAPAANLTSAYAVRGLQGATSSSTNTTYNVTADYVILRNPSTGDVVAQKATATRSNSILTSGPAADGRDQASAFTAPTWLHFYYIWNGSTLSTLSSLCAPSDINGQCSANTGPTLPTGYTHWAYIGAVRMATAGTLNGTYIRGQRALPSATASVANQMAITTAESTVSMVNFVPPNAGAFTVYCTGSSTAGPAFGAVTGMYTNQTWNAAAAPTVSTVELPNIAQQFFFVGTAAAGVLNCQLQSYTIPNGG